MNENIICLMLLKKEINIKTVFVKVVGNSFTLDN